MLNTSMALEEEGSLLLGLSAEKRCCRSTHVSVALPYGSVDFGNGGCSGMGSKGEVWSWKGTAKPRTELLQSVSAK